MKTAHVDPNHRLADFDFEVRRGVLIIGRFYDDAFDTATTELFGPFQIVTSYSDGQLPQARVDCRLHAFGALALAQVLPAPLSSRLGAPCAGAHAAQ